MQPYMHHLEEGQLTEYDSLHQQAIEQVIDLEYLENFDPVAFEATLAFFRANPEPPQELIGYQAMLDDAVAGYDWMEPEDR